jgi:hypothetical protein
VHSGERSFRLLPEPGSPGRALALTIICVLAAVLLLGGYFTWSTGSTNAQLVATNQRLAATNVKLREEQAAAQKGGLLIEKAICLDMGTMAAIPPPAGAGASNPSRAYERAEHRAWQGLFDGLRCGKT